MPCAEFCSATCLPYGKNIHAFLFTSLHMPFVMSTCNSCSGIFFEGIIFLLMPYLFHGVVLHVVVLEANFEACIIRE